MAVSDPAGARRLGNASTGVSVAGIIVTVVVAIVVVALVVTAIADSDVESCDAGEYLVRGSCYRNRFYIGFDIPCNNYNAVKSDGYCYY